jgi:hypothetical protein
METFQIYKEVVMVVVEAQVLQGGEVEWAGPILNGAGIFILFIKCNTYGRKLSSQ